jgi:hypothetical protein
MTFQDTPREAPRDAKRPDSAKPLGVAGALGAGAARGFLEAISGLAWAGGAILALTLWGHFIPLGPKAVLIGLDCGAERVRVYGLDDGREAAKACLVVERHAMPEAR